MFAETCSGTCYTDYVIGDASYYDTAYFEVDSVRIFSASGTNTVVSSSDALMIDQTWSSKLATLLGAGAAAWLAL